MSKIVMTQPLCAAGYEPLAQEGPVYVANDSNPSHYLQELNDAECVVVRIGHMNRAEIEAAPKLRVIGRSGIGYDSIDVAAANERGIPIVIAPHCNADSVAEHTVALMFALASDLVECHNEAVRGNFEIRNCGKMFELKGLTLGIIGFGDIGTRVGRLCRAIGMKLAVYDPCCYNVCRRLHRCTSRSTLAGCCQSGSVSPPQMEYLKSRVLSQKEKEKFYDRGSY